MYTYFASIEMYLSKLINCSISCPLPLYGNTCYQRCLCPEHMCNNSNICRNETASEKSKKAKIVHVLKKQYKSHILILVEINRGS